MWPEIKRFLNLESAAEKEARQRELDALRERYRQEEEQFAEESIYHLYINSQMNYSGLAQQMRTLAHEASNLTQSSSREFLARMRFDAMQHQGHLSDEVLEKFDERILSDVNASPERKGEIKINALGNAVGYWQERLEQPDLTPEEMIYGRQRKNFLQSKLNDLTNPDTASPQGK